MPLIVPSKNAICGGLTVEQRRVEHARWLQEVVEPAERASEGTRCLVFGKARLRYEIAPLPDGQFAMHVNFDLYLLCGVGDPWRVYETREAALEDLLQTARQWFGYRVKEAEAGRLNGARDSDAADCRAMVEALSGLFFVEPLPTP